MSSQASGVNPAQPTQPRGAHERRDAGPCTVCGKPIPPRNHPGGSKKERCSVECRRVAYERAHPGLRAVPPEARQRALPLTPPAEPLIPTRDQRVPRARRRHFSEQAQAILTRLEAGPCSNAEMARMFPPATAWRSRLSDARWELRRRFGLRDDEDPIPGYDCGGGLVWHWIEVK